MEIYPTNIIRTGEMPPNTTVEKLLNDMHKQGITDPWLIVTVFNKELRQWDVYEYEVSKLKQIA